VSRIERTVIVVGFAARKGNGSGVKQSCLVDSSRVTRGPTMSTVWNPGGGKGPSGCGVGRYRCPSPRAVNLAGKHPQIHQKVFSLSLPFPPCPRGRVFGDGFGDRDPSPNSVRWR
jgi:hypothetical protein